jgi:hypothetical protein
MDATQFNDFKQLLEDSIIKSERRLRTEIRQGFDAIRQEMVAGSQSIRSDMSAGFQAMRTEMAASFAGVGDSIESLSDMIEAQHQETSQRLTRLEKQTQ